MIFKSHALRFNGAQFARPLLILLMLVAERSFSQTQDPRGGPLDFPWGSSREEVVAHYGDRLRPSTDRYDTGPYYEAFKIPVYEFEGLKFVASLRLNRETQVLGEVLLVLSSPETGRPSLLPEFDRLDRIFTKLLGVTNARYSSDESTPFESISRGAIWSAGRPWVRLQYQYFKGSVDSLIINLHQSSRRTSLG